MLTKNGVWEITQIKNERLPFVKRGWLKNTKTGQRYVWSIHNNGTINYVKEISPPRGIPKYLEREIRNWTG